MPDVTTSVFVHLLKLAEKFEFKKVVVPQTLTPRNKFEKDEKERLY